MRTYTVTASRPNGLPPVQHTYHGFNRRFGPTPPSHVAVVSVDGEVECYALDGPDTTGLMAYLEEQGAGTIRLLGCYARQP